MSDTFITVIAVVTVALVMFVFPLMAIANQNDDITQTSVQTLVSDFVNTCAKEGKITQRHTVFCTGSALRPRGADHEVSYGIYDPQFYQRDGKDP